jgi:hypothetical protein
MVVRARNDGMDEHVTSIDSLIHAIDPKRL